MDPSDVDKTVIDHTVRVEHRTTVDIFSVADHKQASFNSFRATLATYLKLVNLDVVVVCFKTTSNALVERY